MLERRATVLFLLLVVSACSARSNNFGGPADAGDASADTNDDDAPDQTPEPAQLGEICHGPMDCVDGALCIGTIAGEFRCMAKCSVEYTLCDDDAVCLPVMTQDAAICYTGGSAAATETCMNNLDCGPGLLCFGAATEFYCRPACTAGGCADGEFCEALDSGAGLCRSTIGTACATATDCEAGLLCSEDVAGLGGVFRGGYCTLECQRDDDCGDGARCRKVGGAAQSICLQRCSHRSDCRFNGAYDCLDASGCVGSSDPTACQATFGEDSLCVPGVF